MLKLITLAWRNVFRNKRRSIITFITISISIFALVVVTSLLEGIGNQSERTFIDLETSHCKIFAEGYNDNKDNNPLDYSIKNPEEIMQELQKEKEIAGVTGRIVFIAILNNGVNEIPCLAIGIDPNSDKNVFKLKQYLIDGEYIKTDEELTDIGVMVGSRLSELLELKVGDYITVICRTLYGTIEALDVVVKGILSTGDPNIDNSALFISLPIAQKILEMENNITEIAVRFKSDKNLNSNLDKVKSVINKKGKMEVFSWKKLTEEFQKLHNTKKTGQAIILSLIVMLSAVGIVNTMLMASFERTREIGMLMALGMKPSGISRLFLLEGAFIGLLGSIIGCILGGIVAYYMEVVGVSFGQYGDIDIGYPIKNVFYGDLTVINILGSLLFGVFISILASWYPAHRASNLNPTEALRYV